MAAHEFAGLPAHERCRRTVPQHVVDCRCECANIALSYEPRGDAIGRHGGDTAGWRGYERSSRRHDFHHRVGKPVDIPGIIVHRRRHRGIRSGEQRRYQIVRDNTEESHDVAYAGGLRSGSKRRLEVAITGNGDAQPWILRFQKGGSIYQILKSLLLDEPADREDQRYIIRDAEPLTATRPQIGAWMETL